MTLTKEQKQNYLDKKGCVCPFCGSENIEAGPLEADGMVAWSSVGCDDCEKTWQDEYNLVNVEMFEYPAF
tara:strand:- start:303 stop:512 length:210 start_codon:yes stop_codon:yes gene_type:complete